MTPKTLIAQALDGPRFSAVPSLDQAQESRRRLTAANGDGQLVSGIEPHIVNAVMAIDGDCFAICSCGANSLPLVSLERARMWLCPRQEAESTVAKNAAWLKAALARVAAFERGR